MSRALDPETSAAPGKVNSSRGHNKLIQLQVRTPARRKTDNYMHREQCRTRAQRMDQAPVCLFLQRAHIGDKRFDFVVA
jgi:hypothetical protein